MSDYSMADISSLLQSVGKDNGLVAKNSTSKKNNIDLDMTDFLKLMVVQLQSQTIDDTMDTSEMMNQMVQMQMITAITNMTETNIMTYASSLVGKEVTIGITDGTTLEERVVNIIGTGMSNGSQVIFGDDGETYALSQIMAVGRLPEIDGVTKPENSTTPTTPTAPATPTVPGGGSTTQTSGDTVDKPVTPPAGSEESAESTGNENKEPIVESPELTDPIA